MYELQLEDDQNVVSWSSYIIIFGLDPSHLKEIVIGHQTLDVGER